MGRPLRGGARGAWRSSAPRRFHASDDASRGDCLGIRNHGRRDPAGRDVPRRRRDRRVTRGAAPGAGAEAPVGRGRDRDARRERLRNRPARARRAARRARDVRRRPARRADARGASGRRVPALDPGRLSGRGAAPAARERRSGATGFLSRRGRAAPGARAPPAARRLGARALSAGGARRDRAPAQRRATPGSRRGAGRRRATPRAAPARARGAGRAPGPDPGRGPPRPRAPRS